jgi:hypothetical protein
MLIIDVLEVSLIFPAKLWISHCGNLINYGLFKRFLHLKIAQSWTCISLITVIRICLGRKFDGDISKKGVNLMLRRWLFKYLLMEICENLFNLTLQTRDTSQTLQLLLTHFFETELSRCELSSFATLKNDTGNPEIIHCNNWARRHRKLRRNWACPKKWATNKKI